MIHSPFGQERASELAQALSCASVPKVSCPQNIICLSKFSVLLKSAVKVLWNLDSGMTYISWQQFLHQDPIGPGWIARDLSEIKPGGFSMMRSLESQYDSLRQEDVRSKASTDPMYKYYKRMLPKPRLTGDIESCVVLYYIQSSQRNWLHWENTTSRTRGKLQKSQAKRLCLRDLGPRLGSDRGLPAGAAQGEAHHHLQRRGQPQDRAEGSRQAWDWRGQVQAQAKLSS